MGFIRHRALRYIPVNYRHAIVSNGFRTLLTVKFIFVLAYSFKLRKALITG